MQGQEAEILAYFKGLPESTRTNRELRAVFPYEQASISRALTNLTDKGALEMSKKTVRCRVTGKSVHTWRLAPKPAREPATQDGLW